MARKSLIIFLVTGSRLRISRIKLVLEDFLEAVREEGSLQVIEREMTEKDYTEIEKILKSPRDLPESYLLKEISPFILPFYER